MKLYFIKMSDGREMRLLAASSCLAFMLAQEIHGIFASSVRLA